LDFFENKKKIEDNFNKKKIEKEKVFILKNNTIITELNEEADDKENENDDFNIDDFLNPKKGSKNWLEEQPEKIKVLIEERKYEEAVKLILEIRECDLGNADYENKLEIDNVYNFLIEKLTINISVN
jgi:hypothetical protein